MMADRIQLGHSKDKMVWKVCACITHERHNKWNNCPIHKDVAPYGMMLDAEQALEAATGLLKANTAQEKRQKEVHE